MKTRDFVRICKKMSKVCNLIGSEKKNIADKWQYGFYALDFERLGKVYEKLNKRKNVKELMKVRNLKGSSPGEKE